MGVFKYEAVDSTGKNIKGERASDTREEVVNYLQSNGLTVMAIDEKIGIDFRRIANIEVGGIALAERVIIVKQLATMVSAGIPIIQAIDILIQQSEKESVKAKLTRVYKAIEGGLSLSESFKKEEGIFSEVQINLIAAGEKSGNLNEMLLQVAIDMEKSKILRSKVVGALIYPAIIFVVLIIVLVVMIVFMVPQVKDLYQTLGQNELPFVTQTLVSMGDLFANPLYVILFLIFIFSLYLSYRYYYSLENGRSVIDRLKLKVPVFGNLLRKIDLIQFCRVLAMLLKSGIPIIDAIDIVSRSLNNKSFIDVANGAKKDVIKGSTLSLAIAKNDKHKAFSILLVKTIATGEEAGKLDKVLIDMADFYEAEVEQITGNLTKLLEPFILVLVGVLVAFLAVAIYLPIYQVGNFIQ